MPARPEPEPGDRPSAMPDGVAELGELWRYGLDASREMAARVLDLYRDLPPTGPGRDGDVETELRRLRIDLDRAVDLSVDVFDRVLALASRLDPSADDVAGAHDADHLLVLHARPGDVARGTLWIHNRSDREQPAPELQCAGFTSFEHAAIPAAHARLGVATEPIAAWNSRGVELAVDVPRSMPPGSYHGLVLARDDVDLSFRVRIDVSDVVVDWPSGGGRP